MMLGTLGTFTEIELKFGEPIKQGRMVPYALVLFEPEGSYTCHLTSLEKVPLARLG